MIAWIKQIGEDLVCRSESGLPPEVRIPGDKIKTALKAWATRYDDAVRKDRAEDLFAIGREMFTLLDHTGWASAWARGTGPRALDIRVEDLEDDSLARLMVDAPWELLVGPQGYLTDDRVQLFEITRRMGKPAQPVTPAFSDLHLMFMAAAPRGGGDLEFEAEEAAILEATARLPLHLAVEESGTPSFLKERLDLDGPFEALHISCHGDILPARGHILMLEDEVGAPEFADAGTLVSVLGNPERTPLVFLSACKTAEQSNDDSKAPRWMEPFVRDLVRGGIANVMGWDGSVMDSDASAFAQIFYRELASRENIPRAAAIARKELRLSNQDDPKTGRHWHLARLYIGPKGGGALSGQGQPKRRPAGAAYQDQFLDKDRGEVPVAGPLEFVGRRRQAQDVLKAFRDRNSGVLIHGMGNLGKSSLAARIAARMTGHKTVVIFGAYDGLSVFDRLIHALPPKERKGIQDEWRNAILDDPSSLEEAIEALLADHFDQNPVLLIIDDLERILETPQKAHTPCHVKSGYRPPMTAILSAFARARTDACLLITSRYRFSLYDASGRDLARGLVPVPMRPMKETDREKQLRTALRVARPGKDAFDPELALQALVEAQGNPGLQATLMTPILNGEAKAARDALAAIRHFRVTGAPPKEIQNLMDEGVARDEANAMVAFFRRMAFHTYRSALTPDQAAMLKAACLFSPGLPIPRPAHPPARAEGGGSGNVHPHPGRGPGPPYRPGPGRRLGKNEQRPPCLGQPPGRPPGPQDRIRSGQRGPAGIGKGLAGRIRRDALGSALP